MPVREIAASCGERHKPPERPREAFQIGRRAVEMRCRRVKPDARIALGEVGQQRLEQVVKGPAHVCTAFERVPGERIGAGRIIGHGTRLSL